MVTFEQFVVMREEGEYCSGVSINADFFWNQESDVSFLTIGGKNNLINSVLQAVQSGKMQVFDKRLTAYGNDPSFGFTYLVVLGQSHILIHTWPERHFMNLDVFTCGNEGDPNLILNYLRTKLNPEQVQMNQAQRGVRKDIKSATEPPDSPAQINTVAANA